MNDGELEECEEQKLEVYEKLKVKFFLKSEIHQEIILHKFIFFLNWNAMYSFRYHMKTCFEYLFIFSYLKGSTVDVGERNDIHPKLGQVCHQVISITIITCLLKRHLLKNHIFLKKYDNHDKKSAVFQSLWLPLPI